VKARLGCIGESSDWEELPGKGCKALKVRKVGKNLSGQERQRKFK